MLDADPTDGRPLVYLATPYSHPDKEVMQQRYEKVGEACAEMMRAGYNVFSPITHSHPLAQKYELPEEWSFWEEVDRDYLSCSYVLVVLALDGWKESTGVQAEMEIADEVGIPVRFLDPSNYQICSSP